jgi:LAO/AO transport system kinase
MWQQLLADLNKGDTKALARSISFVENEMPGHEEFLQSLPHINKSKIIGVTGPPGAGKSTLVDGLIKRFIEEQYKIAVLCIDPSSPFNHGAVLGDRIRMSEWYNHPDVFIRSLATRGSMGGITNNIPEITDILKAAGFDYIIIETVGVGQSEVEIAGLADTTVVVLVPEAGDEVQAMKSGLMEIADVFVINKSDRPGADELEKNLRQMLAPVFSNNERVIPIIRTVASQNVGITELYDDIQNFKTDKFRNEKKVSLLVEKAYHIIRNRRMKGVNKTELQRLIESRLSDKNFNLYSLAKEYS